MSEPNPTYTVIVPGEDGLRVYRMDRPALLKALRDNDFDGIDFSAPPPDGADPNCWRSKGLIVEGRIVHPRAAEVVTAWEI